MSRYILGLFIIFSLLVMAGLGFWLLRGGGRIVDRSARLMDWLRNPLSHPDWQVHALQQCGDAPFLFPTLGYVGFLWDDSFRVGHRHQGIDIFGGTEGNITPVYAAYPGYLTRLLDWKSSVIIRIPEDPLQTGRQIWNYYTHLAGPGGESYIEGKFPPGALEIPVQAGELLGFQGNYSGTIGNPTGVHLHFSIVKDDGKGKFLNELEIQNTLDPTPYLGLPLNAKQNPDAIPVCPQ